MTAPAGTGGGGGAWRWIVVVLVGVVLTVVLVPSRSERRPYDLASTEPDGYRGLALLLDRFDADVTEIDADDVDAGLVDDRDVVFVPEGDGVGEELAGRLRDVAAAGGRVVLGAPSEWIGATPSEEAGFDDVGLGSADVPLGDPGTCDLPELADADAVQVPFFALLLDVGDTDSS